MSANLLPEKRWRRNALSAVILFHLIEVPLGSYWTETRKAIGEKAAIEKFEKKRKEKSEKTDDARE
jgi:hypothetical protein